MEGKMAKEQYNADSITVLEGLEAVRKRDKPTVAFHIKA